MCKLLAASIYVIHLATGGIQICSIVAWIILIPTNSSPGSQNEMEYLPLQLCQPNTQLSTSSLPPRSHLHPNFWVYKSLIVTSIGLWLDSAGCLAFSGFSFPFKFLFLSSLCVRVCGCAGSQSHCWNLSFLKDNPENCPKAKCCSRATSYYSSKAVLTCTVKIINFNISDQFLYYFTFSRLLKSLLLKTWCFAFLL